MAELQRSTETSHRSIGVPHWLSSPAGLIVVLAAGYLASAMGGLAISRQAGNIATLWPPNGMLAAALLLSAAARWRHVLLAGAIGSIAANLLNGSPVVAACSITLANLVEAWLAATLIRRGARARHLFQEPSDVMVLIVASITAAVAAGVLSASMAAGISGLPFARTFAKWILGDVLGLLIVTPIAVIVHDLLRDGVDLMLARRSQLEAALILFAVFSVTLAVFQPDMPPVQFLIIPMVLLASFRLGPLGAAMSAVIVAIIGSIGTVAAAQQGAATPEQVTVRVLFFQLYLATLFLSALPIGAAMARREQLAHDLLEAKERADRAAKEMEQLASVDDLTGLASRRQFLSQLDRMAEAARRAEQPLTLAMIDIDHFKPINDAHGHSVGDAVLMAIGAACRTAVRAHDVIGRLGGEEFAMLMPVTDEATAFRIVDRLREAVAEIRIPTLDGTSVSVTISVGLAVFGNQQIDRLLIDADRALYMAKEQGRNRVALARTDAVA
jgi:diguanylate cyclase (GGDEF)-like protein